MQVNFESIQFHVGSLELIERMPNIPTMHCFSPRIIDFLGALSSKLMIIGRKYPDVVSFAYWCRRSALEQYKKRYSNLACRIGRGIVFQIAPSNVPINFCFSLASGLLAGNANILRLPSKNFPQVSLVTATISEILENGYEDMKPYICLISYPHDNQINEYLSSICSTRVIWGGDDTIDSIRAATLKPRANEITFANRFSIAIIDSDVFLKDLTHSGFAKKFYNDTYLSDQNACTSPRIIIWLGSKVPQAKEIFWSAVEKEAERNYEMLGFQTVGKMVAFCNLAASQDVKLSSNLHAMYAMRVQIPRLFPELIDFFYNSGYYIEYDAQRLEEILPICSEQLQTISCLGIECQAVLELLSQYCPRGGDRVVPMGRTMDFDLTWDGYDLIERMSRMIWVG